MPLNPGNLAKELTALFLAKPISSAEFAEKFAKAYNDYASLALAGVVPPVFTGSEQSVMIPILATGFLGPTLPPIPALAIATAVAAYWSLPPVMFTAPPIVGLAAPPLGLQIAVEALTVIFAVPNPSEAAVGAAVAAAVDILTRTVIVTFTLPLPTPPPPAPLV